MWRIYIQQDVCIGTNFQAFLSDPTHMRNLGEFITRLLGGVPAVPIVQLPLTYCNIGSCPTNVTVGSLSPSSSTMNSKIEILSNAKSECPPWFYQRQPFCIANLGVLISSKMCVLYQDLISTHKRLSVQNLAISVLFFDSKTVD
jgi:hypothetical protein